MLTYHQTSLKLLFAYKLSHKKSKSVEHRVTGSLFRRHQLVKERSAQIYTTPIWIGLNEFGNRLRTVMMWVLSSVIIIAQGHTRNTEYVIGWLKKINLEQLLFEYGTFFGVSIFFPVLSSETYWKKLVSQFYGCCLSYLSSIVKVLTLKKDSFTSFVHVSILCLRHQGSS